MFVGFLVKTYNHLSSSLMPYMSDKGFRSLRLLHQIDQRPRLPLIQTPTLVIAGQYDRVVHPSATKAAAALIPNARYQELPRCGHAPFISHVHEVVELIQEFAAELTS